MKTLFLFSATLLMAVSAQAQLVATVELKQPITGICNNKEIYALFASFTGQMPAVCPVSNAGIEARLNDVPFIKANPKYKAKGSVDVFINCKGEMVKSEMGTPTKSKELDDQIAAVFSALGQWQAGTLDGRAVDSERMYSFRIRGGRITLE